VQVGRTIKPALALIILLLLLHIAGARVGEGMRVVPAQEILDKIERGEPVEYYHVIVEGDLDLSNLDLPKRHVNRTLDEIEYFGLSENALIVSSWIIIGDSTINGNISFGNAIFSNLVGFSGSAFNGTAYFGGSAFNGTADFSGSAFNGGADFGGSAFNGYASFRGSAFNGYASFRGSDFNSDASFRGSDFNGTAYFRDSDFNGNTYLGESNFNGNAYFGESDFNGNASFRESNFNGTAYFGESDFNSDASFRGSDFNGGANFGESDFNNSDFSSAQFNRPVTFDDANFSNFTSFQSSRFKEDALFEGTVFDGTLFLNRAKYDRLYIRWKNIRELGYDDAAYLTLLENFKKLGYVEDYDACYYEYRRLHRDQSWSGKYHAMHPWEEWLRKRIDLGLDAFYGYGKKPILPLIWSAATILFFGLIWRKAGVDGRRGKGQGIFERYGLREAHSRRRSGTEEIHALLGAVLFSATLFLSGTRLFVDPPALPALQGWFAAHAQGFFIAERVLGALFSILFFLAISGTVVR